MATIPSFNQASIEAISRALVEGISHRELTILLAELRIDEQGGGPRWERLYLALIQRQQKDSCANNVVAFIQAALVPVRYTTNPQLHDAIRQDVNVCLAFSGLQVDAGGQLRPIRKAGTLSEAEHRAKGLRENLLARRVHENILQFCTPELVSNDYFHAVLEATKSVAQKVRDRTGVPLDGAALFTRVFGGQTPLLAINSLQTAAELFEQRGFVTLLIGAFGVFRNPTAHAPRLVWSMDEQDALDLLSLASYLHRRIDGASRTPWS